jgi:hypothetical protein
MSRAKLDKLPYAETDVPVDRSRTQISKMLENLGADGVSWSELYRPIQLVAVEFIKDDMRYQLKVPIHVEDLERERDNIAPSRYREVLEKRKRAMYRALYYYISGLLKAQQHGLMSFEEAFVGHRRVMLSSGVVSTIAEAVTERKVDLGRALPEPGGVCPP